MKKIQIIAGFMAGVLGIMSASSPVWAEEVLTGPGVALQQTVAPTATPAQYGLGSPLDMGAAKNPDFLSTPIENPIVTVTDKYGYDQMELDIIKMQNTYGNLMQTNIIGTTADGRNLYEVVIGNPNAGKHVMIQAGIHAREYMTPLLVMRQMEYALAFFYTGVYAGQNLSDLFQQVAIHFIPMTNPDGISISQFGLNAVRSEELKQAILANYELDRAEGRTNASLERYLIYWKANARGVDLNLNFNAGWEAIPGIAHPSYAGYKGPTPMSELESTAMVNLGNQRTWSAVINYHSMGNIIYWDYVVNNTRESSAQLAQQISAVTGYRMTGSNGGGGYKDWMQCKENPAPSVTLEVGQVSCPLPLSEFAAVWEQNKSVWALTMNYALTH